MAPGDFPAANLARHQIGRKGGGTRGGRQMGGAWRGRYPRTAQIHRPSIRGARGGGRWLSPLPEAPDRCVWREGAGPEGPARTRSVVHQIAPVVDAHDRARPRGAAGSWAGWRTALAVIASLLSQSRSFPSPEEVATAPVRRCPTLKERSLTGSGPSPPSRVSHLAPHSLVSADWEAPRHRCLFAGSFGPTVSFTRPAGQMARARWRADGRRSEPAAWGK